MKNNAAEILRNVETAISKLEARETWESRRFRISAVCEQFSIFDWWNDFLSISQLKDMRKFLKEAIKLGYTGYVCFKVGATGCANGMWAHKLESTDGYSPDEGGVLYKSFTPAYNYWSIRTDEGKWLPDDNDYTKYDQIKTIKQLEEFIKKAS